MSHAGCFAFCPVIPSWLFPKGLLPGASYEVDFPQNADAKPPRGMSGIPLGAGSPFCSTELSLAKPTYKEMWSVNDYENRMALQALGLFQK
jgi:hypothetical protein